MTHLITFKVCGYTTLQKDSSQKNPATKHSDSRPGVHILKRMLTRSS